MIVTLNDKPYEVAQGMTLDAFMEKFEIPLHGIAISIEYEVIPKNKWPETTLEDGMSFMLIHAVSGG